MVCPPVRGDNLRALTLTMVKLFYTTYIGLGPSHYEIVGKGGIND